MEVIIESDPLAVSKSAAVYFINLLARKPAAVLGLATGGTPLGLYELLVEAYKAGRVDFSKVTTFNLDEYVGLSAKHPASYRAYMQKVLFEHINVSPDRVHIPDGVASDITAHCEAYEKAIQAAGGIDLQLLGLGSDGHIGFNELSSSLASRTRLKTLTAQTMADNAQYFASPDEIPQHVITMGVGTIMEARHCLMMATGHKKARAVAAMVEGPITASCPASILQMHPKCTLIIDEDAASALERSDYYRWVHAHKPAWQS